MTKRAAAKTVRRRPRLAKLKPPSLEQVMQVSFALAKEVSLEMREEELVGTFASALRALLPDRLLCLRIVEPRTLQLTSMVADGPLSAEVAGSPLAIKRSAMKRTRIPESIAVSKRLRVVDGYQPVFEKTSAGFSVPLVASGEIFGLLNVEYPSGQDVAAADEPLIIPLANQLSVALRNQNLLGETRYYRDYLHQVIDVANALIIVVDREQNIAVMNAAMQRYLGWGNEVLGQPLDSIRRREIVAPEPRLGTMLVEGLSGQEFSDVELTVMKKDGTLGRALFDTAVVRAPDGSVDGVLAIGQDLERIRSLERQVIQAEKLATLGQLAAGVVHELNNPLTSISVYGDYLLKLMEKEGLREDLDKAKKIVEGAGRIQKLTRDLMSYARPAGEFEPVQLNDVVRQSLVFCEHILGRVEAVVELHLDENLPRVHAIRTQLHQVFINLVTNACHALPAPGQTITVATSLSADARELLVEVADTGVGIDEGDRSRIFEPFFTTKKEGKGTGLGLSIVKNIVEGHGGRLSFDSRVGEGTTFRICLPVDSDSEQILGT
jgi:two-component system, NtrC family, sensor kinase